jgi:CO dehydrogenase nickel-insertion accessory protein CooC1
MSCGAVSLPAFALYGDRKRTLTAKHRGKQSEQKSLLRTESASFSRVPAEPDRQMAGTIVLIVAGSPGHGGVGCC